MKINSISNCNFKANKNQNPDDKDSKMGHKTYLFLGSLMCVTGIKLSKDTFVQNKPSQEPDLKTLKEFFTKENLKSTGKTIGTYLGLSLILASVINFIYDEEKAKELIEHLMLTRSM